MHPGVKQRMGSAAESAVEVPVSPRDGVESPTEHSTSSRGETWLVPHAAYVHIPFCAHHCGYCDFAVVAGKDHLADRYLDALAREMCAGQAHDTVNTLHIGGGTPTQLDVRQLERLQEILRQRYTLAPGGEFAVEANPNRLDDEKLALLATFGVNRLSLGAQSFQPPLLELLERQHTPHEIEDVVTRARRFMPNLSLDLIFGTPGQTLAQWQEDLERVIDLGIPHVSTYGLTYEKGTRMWKQRERRIVIPLEEESERTLYGTAMDTLTAAGFEHYEISNFARPGFRSRHNQVYWANEAYFGHGLGAARYLHGVRSVNTRDLDAYLRKVEAGDDPTQQSETLPPEERARETAMCNLRRMEGIVREQFQQQTGYAIDDLCGQAIKQNVQRGLLEDTGESLFLTHEGKFLADSVCGDFLVARV